MRRTSTQTATLYEGNIIKEIKKRIKSMILKKYFHFSSKKNSLGSKQLVILRIQYVFSLENQQFLHLLIQFYYYYYCYIYKIELYFLRASSRCALNKILFSPHQSSQTTRSLRVKNLSCSTTCIFVHEIYVTMREINSKIATNAALYWTFRIKDAIIFYDDR